MCFLIHYWPCSKPLRGSPSHTDGRFRKDSIIESRDACRLIDAIRSLSSGMSEPIEIRLFFQRSKKGWPLGRYEGRQRRFHGINEHVARWRFAGPLAFLGKNGGSRPNPLRDKIAELRAARSIVCKTTCWPLLLLLSSSSFTAFVCGWRKCAKSDSRVARWFCDK